MPIDSECFDITEHERLKNAIKDNNSDYFYNAISSIPGNALDYDDLLITAVDQGDQSKVEHLLGLGADINICPEQTSETPLFVACFNGDVSMARFFLNNKAAINFQDKDGDSLLHIAVMEHHIEIVCLLLEYDVNVNVINNDSQTPFDLAAMDGDLAAVKLLYQHGANINGFNPQKAPILLAAKYNHSETVEFLLKKKASIHCLSTLHNTLLMEVIFWDEKTLAEKILEEYPVVCTHIDHRNFNGETALMIAVKRSYQSASLLLLKMGADMSLEDSFHRDALFYAVLNGDLRMIAILQQYNNGCHTQAHAKKAIEMDERSALFYLLANVQDITDLTCYAFFHHQYTIADLLTEKGNNCKDIMRSIQEYPDEIMRLESFEVLWKSLQLPLLLSLVNDCNERMDDSVHVLRWMRLRSLCEKRMCFLRYSLDGAVSQLRVSEKIDAESVYKKRYGAFYHSLFSIDYQVEASQMSQVAPVMALSPAQIKEEVCRRQLSILFFCYQQPCHTPFHQVMSDMRNPVYLEIFCKLIQFFSMKLDIMPQTIWSFVLGEQSLIMTSKGGSERKTMRLTHALTQHCLCICELIDQDRAGQLGGGAHKRPRLTVGMPLS